MSILAALPSAILLLYTTLFCFYHSTYFTPSKLTSCSLFAGEVFVPLTSYRVVSIMSAAVVQLKPGPLEVQLVIL